MAFKGNVKQPALLVIQDESTLAVEPNMKKVKEEWGIKFAVNFKNVYKRQNLGGDGLRSPQPGRQHSST